MHFIHSPACRKGVAHVPDAVGSRFAQLFFEQFAILGFFVHAVHAHLQAAQGFLERLLEGTANGHDFAHTLHLRGHAAVGLRKFFERKTRNLDYYIIHGRLEASRNGSARDIVPQLIQRVTQRQFGRDLGDRETCGLGCQRRRARNARIHLNHDHAPIFGIDGKLYVGAPGFHANFAQNGDAGSTHQLILFISHRLRRRHGDAVACVHAHGVEVFDRADDDAVVRLVTHHLHFVLFPAEQRFFDQQLVGGRCFQPALANMLEFFGVVGHATTGSAQGETGANDSGETNIFLNFPCFDHVVRHTTTRRC